MIDQSRAESTSDDAREDWERRIYQRLTDTSATDPSTDLPAPTHLLSEPGIGHVRLSWNEVKGAAGYVIQRSQDGARPQILSHGGSDVPAIAACVFADTGLADSIEYTYRVGAVAGAEFPAWNWSDAVTGQTRIDDPAPVSVHVDTASVIGELHRVWQMVGSERLTQLRFGDDGHRHDIGAEFAEALLRAHDDLGVTCVRAHAILHDDNAVVTRADDGILHFDFTNIDEQYDRVLALGIRPVVELSFMPAALARDPEQTVFTYRGIISAPRDLAEWHDLVAALAQHLVDRYGIEEVRTWGFEVWNEANLVVFWSGTQREYLRLYAESARAVKSVDASLRVGGPSTAAAEWIEALAAFCESEDLPLDFATSHTYGNIPLDQRPALERHGFGDAPIWWTEWGVGSTHFGAIHDTVFGAPFVLSGYAAVQGRMEALAYWVVSDHFEELGRPPKLFHNGFGLLTVGNLRKPRYWATHLAAHLGDHVLDTRVAGDGAGVLVQAWATRHDDGTVDVLVWNGTINAELFRGDHRLDRQVSLTIENLLTGTYTAELARIDHHHSNIVEWLPTTTDWPDAEQTETLRAHDLLDTELLGAVGPVDGVWRIDFELPMPGVVRVRLRPATSPPMMNEESAR
ncbi:MAG: GH39 family glycosyl hydrolase [Ilumatobacteraceae bacterium]